MSLLDEQDKKEALRLAEEFIRDSGVDVEYTAINEEVVEWFDDFEDIDEESYIKREEEMTKLVYDLIGSATVSIKIDFPDVESLIVKD